MIRDPFDIIHAENWAALAIAILYRAPISPETAAILYEDGVIGRPGVKQGAENTARMIQDLRDEGCTWAEVKQLTGLKYPESIMCHWRRRHGTTPRT